MDRRSFVAAGATALGSAWLSTLWPDALLGESQGTLKALGAPCSMRIGFAAVKPVIQNANPAFLSFAKSNFNLFTPESELKWGAVHPMQDCYRFEGADWLLDFAQQNGMAFRGHNLCWNTGNPGWVAQVVTKTNAESILVEHIQKVAGRYVGKIDSWDVVNEPISTWYKKPGGLTPGPWLDALGPQYIDVAFHAAAATDPHALRVLNCHHVEHAREEDMRQATIALLEGMLSRNVPVQAVGFESHLDCALPIDQGLLDKFVRTVRGMGLQILVTELDVNDAKVEGDFPHRDQVVADYYRRYLDIVLPVADIKRMVFWSPTDHSWLDALCKAPQWQRADGACNHRPGLVDDSMQTKPAYGAVAASLQNNCKRDSDSSRVR
jgi:endo-1,4-beta-xylanase